MSAAPLRRLAESVDSLSLRERVMVFVCAITAVLFGWYQVAIMPVLNASEKSVASIGHARDRIREADAAVRAQASALDADAAWGVEGQLDAARRRGDEIEALIRARAAEIVDPATMAQLLEDMLTRQRDLRLIRAKNLEAQALPGTDEGAPLFQHTLQLELEGSYLAVLGYLEALEAMPWRMYWQAIEIDTMDYPKNRIVIEVSTLSFDEEWIGV